MHTNKNHRIAQNVPNKFSSRIHPHPLAGACQNFQKKKMKRFFLILNCLQQPPVPSMTTEVVQPLPLRYINRYLCVTLTITSVLPSHDLYIRTPLLCDIYELPSPCQNRTDCHRGAEHNPTFGFPPFPLPNI